MADDVTDALRAMSEKATPGQWAYDGWFYGDADTESYAVWAGPADTKHPKDPVAKTSRLEQGWHDAMFIAACVNYVRGVLETGAWLRNLDPTAPDQGQP